MPRMTITGCASVTIRGQIDTQVAENVLIYKVLSGTVTESKVDDLANWWGNTGWGQYKTVLPTQFVLTAIIVDSLDPGLEYVRLVTPTGTQTGNRSGGTSQGETAPINWKTAVASRTGRGRTSIGPVSENDVNYEAVQSALLSALANLAAYLIVQHPAGEWIFSVGSRKLHIGRPIVAAIIKALIGAMRTRLTRR